MCVCFYHQVFDDGQCVFLVQDLLRGEELLDRALRVPNFTERDASDIMCTLTKTVEYLHSQGVRWTDRLTWRVFDFRARVRAMFCVCVVVSMFPKLKWLDIKHSWVSAFFRSSIGTWSPATFATAMTADSQNPSGFVILVLPNSSELKMAYWWPLVTQLHSWPLRYISNKDERSLNYNYQKCILKIINATLFKSLWCRFWGSRVMMPLVTSGAWGFFSTPW